MQIEYPQMTYASALVRNHDHAGRGINGRGGFVTIKHSAYNDMFDGSWWPMGVVSNLAPFEFWGLTPPPN